jgi:hypothetical protein
MTTLHVDSPVSDDMRRERLYQGHLFVFSSRPSTQALCDHGREMIEAAFHPHNPLTVHQVLPVEECVRILAKLKPEFIHHPKSKELIQAMLTDLGCDREKTYFDVPRMRSAFPADYLTSGIAYAFHAHRDTWYSAPLCQLNWWLPIYDIVQENCLALYPKYFSHPVKNNSETYNYYEWNAKSRATAAQHVKTDTREQPKAQEPIEPEPQIRVLCPPGGVIIFSGAHLHETVPNTAGVTRFSIDFRTVHRDDVANRCGAPNVDSRCTGTTMRDYMRATDLSRLPEEVVSMYDDGTEVGHGVLVYPPANLGVPAGSGR